jgi:phosphoesterase RecJ-like protein
LDCGDLGRLGKAADYFTSAAHTLCIDHHISNQAFAEENYVFPDASATCELVFELMDRERITKEIAECLYTGIVHDTGMFQFSCTTKKTMVVAGELMEMGIDYSKIADESFYTKTFAQNRVLGQALLNSRLYLDGACIVSAISRAEMEQYNVLPKHLEGIVNQLRVTKGVRVALFLYENEDGTWKGSLRVNGEFNVAEVAQCFGGGGHVKAAGFTIEGPVDTAMERVLSEIKKRL